LERVLKNAFNILPSGSALQELHLFYIYITGTAFNDQHLSYFVNHINKINDKLKHLSLINCDIIDCGFLSQFQQLKTLNLSGNKNLNLSSFFVIFLFK